MLQKNAAECVAEMLACQVRPDKKLVEEKEEVACEEKQHAEEAAEEKHKHEEEEAMTKKATEAKAAWERCEQEEAKAQVTRYEAHAKMVVPMGEPIVGLGSDSEIESRVRFLGVTDLVSEENYLFFVS